MSEGMALPGYARPPRHSDAEFLATGTRSVGKWKKNLTSGGTTPRVLLTDKPTANSCFYTWLLVCRAMALPGYTQSVELYGCTDVIPWKGGVEGGGAIVGA
eukprot:736519-Rhodomonas_salina.2